MLGLSPTERVVLNIGTSANFGSKFGISLDTESDEYLGDNCLILLENLDRYGTAQAYCYGDGGYWSSRRISWSILPQS
jgi:hypothetical protein